MGICLGYIMFILHVTNASHLQGMPGTERCAEIDRPGCASQGGVVSAAIVNIVWAFSASGRGARGDWASQEIDMHICSQAASTNKHTAYEERRPKSPSACSHRAARVLHDEHQAACVIHRLAYHPFMWFRRDLCDSRVRLLFQS